MSNWTFSPFYTSEVTCPECGNQWEARFYEALGRYEWADRGANVCSECGYELPD